MVKGTFLIGQQNSAGVLVVVSASWKVKGKWCGKIFLFDLDCFDYCIGDQCIV